jgi:murein DD-endopeptidase MepM/ murein hydrolase activator NlpD
MIRILFIYFFLKQAFAFAGGPADSSLVRHHNPTTYRQTKTISSEAQIIHMIDSIMDMQTVPVSALNDVLDKIRERNEKEGSSPGSEYYANWDEKNLFPALNERKFDQEKIRLTGNSIGSFFFPVPGQITSPFGWRESQMHKGTDLDLVKGDPVHAAFDGIVRIAGKHGGFGNVVIVRHYNGIETLYAHLSKIKVKPGQAVTSGQVIGNGGNTGKSTGAHLHFEFRFKGNAIDPRSIINFEERKLICEEIIIKNKGQYCAAYPSRMVIYTIMEGDTLAHIARKHGLTIAKLRTLNGITKPGQVKPGQKIRIS